MAVSGVMNIIPFQVFRDECLKRWKFIETDVTLDTQFGCGYPSGSVDMV